MKELEIECRYSTRVGPYRWDIDVESMKLEELEALTEIAEKFRAKRELEAALIKQMNHILERAEKAGYHFCYSTDTNFVDLNNAASLKNIKLDEM